MSKTPEHPETDPRFPSGRWVGFWIQKHPPAGRFETELHLSFSGGVLGGEGRDWVGAYTVRGRYDLGDGRCHWTKSYRGKHQVAYAGFNEGKGIWGTWTIGLEASAVEVHGGFHIWPETMPDPTGSHLTEQADLPVPKEEVIEAEPTSPLAPVLGGEGLRQPRPNGEDRHATPSSPFCDRQTRRSDPAPHP